MCGKEHMLRANARPYYRLAMWTHLILFVNHLPRTILLFVANVWLKDPWHPIAPNEAATELLRQGC